MKATKFYLQHDKGCTRRQAVAFKKEREYTQDEFNAELERVKRVYPRDASKPKANAETPTEEAE